MQEYNNNQKLIINNKKYQCCGKPEIITDKDAGERICRNCGIMFESKMMMGTEICGKNIPINPHYIVGTQTPNIRLPNNTHVGSINGYNRQDLRIVKIFSEIDAISQQLAVTENVKKEANRIARRCLGIKTRRFRKNELAAVCIIIACRITGKNIQFKEVTEIAGSSRKAIWKTYRIVVEELNITVDKIEERTIRIINKICGELRLSQKVLMESIQCFEKIRNAKGNTGRHPKIVAAAVIYLSASEYKTQDQVARAADTSSVSMRHVLKKVKKMGCI